MLKSNPRSNLTTTLDHFEKWIGILKINKTLAVDGKTVKEGNASEDIRTLQEVNLEENSKKDTNGENADPVSKNCEIGHDGKCRY